MFPAVVVLIKLRASLAWIKIRRSLESNSQKILNPGGESNDGPAMNRFSLEVLSKPARQPILLPLLQEMEERAGVRRCVLIENSPLNPLPTRSSRGEEGAARGFESTSTVSALLEPSPTDARAERARAAIFPRIFLVTTLWKFFYTQ